MANSATNKSVPQGNRRRYATLREAAGYLGCTDRTVRTMIADGRLVGYRSGSRLVRVDLNQVDAAMQPFGGGVR
ncbi:excisionase family DNA-binding protein [Mycobacteroides abscessus]|uniref:excisionase family DNA-binding protein n=1 Tax=Mycobacteroides abscessus TaxID=36809 RepID=UPI0005E41888|nr:excisionase family DNA-binding protein [Mycobacteroides abscessus]CPW02414.1 DNA binding domain-containing protein [Mycobacteroides abscessus]